MNLLFMNVQVFFTVGQKEILVLKYQVMRKDEEINSMVCTARDAFTGEEYLKLKPKSKTEDVSEYFALLCYDCFQKGYQKLSIILDNNSTHKAKMQAQLQAHLFDLNIHSGNSC